jgi:hypothetical protein
MAAAGAARAQAPAAKGDLAALVAAVRAKAAALENSQGMRQGFRSLTSAHRLPAEDQAAFAAFAAFSGFSFFCFFSVGAGAGAALFASFASRCSLRVRLASMAAIALTVA